MIEKSTYDVSYWLFAWEKIRAAIWKEGSELFFFLFGFLFCRHPRIFLLRFFMHICTAPHPSLAVFGSGGNCKGILKAQAGVNENTSEAKRTGTKTRDKHLALNCRCEGGRRSQDRWSPKHLANINECVDSARFFTQAASDWHRLTSNWKVITYFSDTVLTLKVLVTFVKNRSA